MAKRKSRQGRRPAKPRWLKFHIDGLLFGTTREELTPAERSIWYDLILLAGRSDPCNGWLQARIESIPRILKAPRSLVERALAKCAQHGKVQIEGDRVFVVNFDRYNPERWERSYYGENVEQSATMAQRCGQIREDKSREDSDSDTEENDGDCGTDSGQIEGEAPYVGGKYGDFVKR